MDFYKTVRSLHMVRQTILVWATKQSVIEVQNQLKSLNYVHPQRLHENYFQLCETLLNATFGREEVIFGKFSYVSKGRLCDDASFKDLCTHNISIERFFSYRHPYVQSTAKYKNIRTKVYCRNYSQHILQVNINGNIKNLFEVLCIFCRRVSYSLYCGNKAFIMYSRFHINRKFCFTNLRYKATPYFLTLSCLTV